jgi:hypothetical protein
MKAAAGQGIRRGGSGWENGGQKEDRWNTHLHISYYDVLYDSKLDNDSPDLYVKKENDGLLYFGGELKDENKRDPFDYPD